jgi:hypothetical protein
LAPGAWSGARVFYYDLPCAALLTLALAGWLHASRRPSIPIAAAAAVAVAAAELVRWEAVPASSRPERATGC